MTALGEETPFRELRGHRGPINDLAITPDGRRLVSASDDQGVRLWDLSADDPSSIPSIVLTGQDDSVLAVAVSRDWIAAAGADTTVRLWARDIDTLKDLARFTAGRDFSSDEREEFLNSGE